jgi:hypothetical protein
VNPSCHICDLTTTIPTTKPACPREASRNLKVSCNCNSTQPACISASLSLEPTTVNQAFSLQHSLAFWGLVCTGNCLHRLQQHRSPGFSRHRAMRCVAGHQYYLEFVPPFTVRRCHPRPLLESTSPVDAQLVQVRTLVTEQASSLSTWLATNHSLVVFWICVQWCGQGLVSSGAQELAQGQTLWFHGAARDSS